MESMFRAAEIVRNRQSDIVRLLQASSVRFVLSGSNATFVWIASVDEAAIRQYRNIEIIIEQVDIERVIAALADLGLIAEMRSDRILFRNELIRHDRWADVAMFAGNPLEGKQCIVPNLDQSELISRLPVVCLDGLVSFQLSRWSIDDQVDLRDLISVGLLDPSWIVRVPSQFASRLNALLEDPDG